MKAGKLLSVLSALAILASMLAVCPVLPGMADTADFTISDNGVYTMDKALSTAPLTLEAEIKFPTAGASRSGVLFGNWCYPVGAFADYDVNASGNPRLYWGKSSGDNETLTFTDVNVFTGEWLHLAIVIDTANTQVHCYVNGELKQSLTTKYTEAIVCSNAFAIGNNIRQGNGYNFRGAVKSLALYNDVRTATEVAADVSAYGTDGLMTHYDMEGLTEGDTLTDTVSGNNATWEQKWLDSKDPVGDYDYSIAVIGDPQTVTRSYPTSLPKIYQYVADTAEEKKVAHVFTMGDLTDTTTGVEKEWVAITDAMDILNGVVPHSMLRGNHDNETWYDRYITQERYNDGVVTMDGTMKNYYREIEMGGTDYLMVTLDWRPDTDEQAWACRVIEAHPDHRVILTTHNFTSASGAITDAGVTGDGADIWTRIASKYPNIVLVLSGHSATEDIVMRKAVGVNGNTVTHVLVDQQDADQPIDGGTGLIAYFYFSNDGKDVEVEFYSPLRDQYYKLCNQFSFELDIPWDNTIPALTAAASDREEETSFDFSVTGLSEYADDKYTASGTYYYTFPATDTAVMDYLDSKLNFYYSREGVVYTQRDPVTNGGDSDGASRWILIWNNTLQRTTSKTSGEVFRKIDSLVPKNSLGQEIQLKNFETTFKARLEYEDYGAIILGFRQQTPGKFVTGWYKFDTSQCFVAIGMKGITITGGSDIVALRGGTGETDNYNHFETSFDDPETEEVEMLTKDITVTVKVVDTLCNVSITDSNGKKYTFEETVPYTASGTLAYAVSTVKGNIGTITLKGLDDAGNAIDLAMPGSENDASTLRFYGGDIAVNAQVTENGYLYTLDVLPVDGYTVNESELYVIDADGYRLTPVKIAENRYSVQTAGGGTVYASFIKKTVKFEADFSELSALVPAKTYTNGVYTSGSDTTGENATDTAVNEWFNSKFGMFYNKEGTYKQMAYLGQSTADGMEDTDTDRALQWKISQDGALEMTATSGTNGQYFRKGVMLAAKDTTGEYIHVSNFEAEVVFNKAGKNARPGGLVVSFHEKSPGGVIFKNTSTYLDASKSGDIVAVGNALAEYVYGGFGDNIAIHAGVVKNNFYCRAAEEVLDVAWSTDDEYKLYVRVVDTTLTWSLTNLTDGQLIATGTDEVNAGSGTISVGVFGAEHQLKSVTITELTSANSAAVDEDADVVYVHTDDGYELKAGTLIVADASGKQYVPTRVGFQSENTQCMLYQVLDADGNVVSLDGANVSAEFYQPTKEDSNIGVIGTSVHTEKEGLRFVHRANVVQSDDGFTVNLGGDTPAKVKDFGLLLASSYVVTDPDTLTLDAALNSKYIKEYSVIGGTQGLTATNRYYDISDSYVDLAVQVNGIVKGGGADDNLVSRVYVVLEDDTVLYGTPAVQNYRAAGGTVSE